MDYTVCGIHYARILEWVSFPFPGDSPNPGIESRSPALHVVSLPAEPQEKPPYILIRSDQISRSVMSDSVL